MGWVTEPEFVLVCVCGERGERAMKVARRCLGWGVGLGE